MENWCYQLCDGVVLPVMAIIAFFWTLYQEFRHQKAKEEKKTQEWDLF